MATALTTCSRNWRPRWLPRRKSCGGASPGAVMRRSPGTGGGDHPGRAWPRVRVVSLPGDLRTARGGIVIGDRPIAQQALGHLDVVARQHVVSGRWLVT